MQISPYIQGKEIMQNSEIETIMKTYMQLVAQDLVQRFGRDLSRVAVIFPNKRAALFLNRELAKACAQHFGDGEVAMWSPSYITISDFFRRRSSLVVADQIELVCRLYDVYQRCLGGSGETLDQFYSWGAVLLSDFDDIDKNMADARKVFQIVTDLHELDNVDYLDEEQRKVLTEFFSLFSADHDSAIRMKFTRLWSRLYDIYTEFRVSLRQSGIAYEGMLYRDVAESAEFSVEYDTCCFIGFNMLQKVEQRIFDKLKDAPSAGDQPRALFYWDYDEYYMNDSHEAGHFIREYLQRYPDALEGKDKRNFEQLPEDNDIAYLSSTTNDMQARYVHDWLLENDRWKAGERTAIVMCDERLLQTVVSSLPEEIEKVNVTTGFPLSQTPATALLQSLIDMQTDRKQAHGPFALKNVWRVLRNPYIRMITDNASALYKRLQSKTYYSADEEFMGDESLAVILEDINLQKSSENSPNYNMRLVQWLQKVIHMAARNRTQLSDMEREALFKTHQLLQRFYSLSASGILRVDLHTLCRLIHQVTAATSIPYHGEPVEGIQIMGVLETRCLDFDHLLILSCNEGNMPKGVNDTSFIPHIIRKSYGLTTVEHKVGIYSYYFYRLLQRCNDVSITYNSSTEGLNTGEMSRFMQQIMVESRRRISRFSLQAHEATTTVSPCSVHKSDNVMQQIRALLLNRCVTPTSLSRYLRCPLSYFYQYVAALRPIDENDPEEIDNRKFGNILHKAAENIYNEIKDDNSCIHKQQIERVLADPSQISRVVDKAFHEELFKLGADCNRKIKYNGLQIINRQVIIDMLGNMLSYEKEHAPFMIIGTEKKISAAMQIMIDGQAHDITVGGYIDRLDMAEQCGINPPSFSRIRVIDYKTGWSEPGVINSIEEIFEEKKIESHSDYYLQAMLYSLIVSQSAEYNPGQLPVSPNLLYVQKTRRKDYSPTLVINKQKVDDAKQYAEEFWQCLSNLIADILNPNIPFNPTTDIRRCEYCDFKKLCGR